MKPADLKILKHVRANARMNLTTISRKTGIPVSTIFDRLRSHEGRLIERFTALLDFAQLGYPVRVSVLLKALPQHKADLRNFLCAHPRVNNLLRINNGYDYAAECLFRDIRESEEFLEMLDARFCVAGRQVFHVIESIAREKLLMDDALPGSQPFE
jgi:DNA-binding Lrp family transcriptional regulator